MKKVTDTDLIVALGITELQSGRLTVGQKQEVLETLVLAVTDGSPLERELMCWADNDPDIDWVKGEPWPPKRKQPA